jgi:Amidase
MANDATPDLDMALAHIRAAAIAAGRLGAAEACEAAVARIERLDVAGLPKSWSLPHFRDFRAKEDAVVVARLKAAGAVIGLPATVAPVGTTAAGLPIGVQVIGAHLHDRTTIAVADWLHELSRP